MFRRLVTGHPCNVLVTNSRTLDGNESNLWYCACTIATAGYSVIVFQRERSEKPETLPTSWKSTTTGLVMLWSGRRDVRQMHRATFFKRHLRFREDDSVMREAIQRGSLYLVHFFGRYRSFTLDSSGQHIL
ncbi:hypothetical protein TNCV_3607411 [Trichonephila clavipes]|nr:hypothetical protein TNCV_3607411 [Trichonephila clavipes]